MKKIVLFIIIAGIITLGFLGFFYYREKVFSKEIVRLEILGPKAAALGQEIEYTVVYKNRGNFTLENPRLIFELPEHSLTEDDKLRLEQSVKDIYPGGEGFAKFKARLLGKEDEVKTAKARLSYVPHNLSARYESSTTFSTVIDLLPLTLNYDLPSKLEKGKEISYSINYFSNVDYPLENMSVRIEETPGFNPSSADPISLDNLEWKLDVLKKGQGGRIIIRGMVLPESAGQLGFSAKIGMWRDGSFVAVKEIRQDVQAQASSMLELSQKVYRSGQYGMENSGPVPPEAGQATTYIIVWQVKNSLNEAKNVKVRAVLPQTVALEDDMSPEDQAAKFSFDSKSREIVWLTGDLSPDQQAYLAFRVALTPAPWQRGMAAEIIGQAVILGEDQFTGSTIQTTAPSVSTNLPDDSANSGGGIVK